MFSHKTKQPPNKPENNPKKQNNKSKKVHKTIFEDPFHYRMYGSA